MRGGLSRTAIVGVALALAATSIDASKAGKAHYRITWDDFTDGFSEVTTHGPSAKWFHFSAGSYVGNDGLVQTTRRGLRVVASGLNPATGRPAFQKTLAQEDENGGLPGGVDHVKWLAYTNHTASSGFPGFDALPGREVACEAVVSGRTFGTNGHPFGGSVIDPNDDLRLAAFAMNTIDFDTFMVYDFFVTNETIYAFYERLPFGRGPVHGDYAAFSYAVPVAKYQPLEPKHLRISYGKTAGVVRWYVNWREVFRVNRIGERLRSREFMTIDHGGTETLVSPNQIACGMGMFSLLDAHLPSRIGLVRLSNAPNFYFDPEFGEPVPEVFFDDKSLASNRLFGQGAELRVRRYWVSSLPSTL
jgi:hypothetical protein